MTALEDELHSYLDPGEKLLWAGRPAQGIVFTPLDLYFIPFSVVWLGFVLYIFWQGLPKTPDPIGGLVSVLFVGIGVYLLVGRFFAELVLPIPTCLWCHGSASDHRVRCLQSVRAIDRSILAQWFEARRPRGRQRHDLLRRSAMVLVRLVRPRFPTPRRYHVLPGCRCKRGLHHRARGDAAAEE